MRPPRATDAQAVVCPQAESHKSGSVSAARRSWDTSPDAQAIGRRLGQEYTAKRLRAAAVGRRARIPGARSSLGPPHPARPRLDSKPGISAGYPPRLISTPDYQGHRKRKGDQSFSRTARAYVAHALDCQHVNVKGSPAVHGSALLARRVIRTLPVIHRAQRPGLLPLLDVQLARTAQIRRDQ
jgi:hypothetical protein